MPPFPALLWPQELDTEVLEPLSPTQITYEKDGTHFVYPLSTCTNLGSPWPLSPTIPQVPPSRPPPNHHVELEGPSSHHSNPPRTSAQELGGIGWDGYCQKMWAANLTCFNSGVVMAKRTPAAQVSNSPYQSGDGESMLLGAAQDTNRPSWE